MSLVLALMAWTSLALGAFHTPSALQGLGEAISPAVCIHRGLEGVQQLNEELATSVLQESGSKSLSSGTRIALLYSKVSLGLQGRGPSLCSELVLGLAFLGVSHH